MHHTLETHLEVPGPGEQGTQHCRALQDIYFIRSLCSRNGNVGDFPKTQKQARDLEKKKKETGQSQGSRQNK